MSCTRVSEPEPRVSCEVSRLDHLSCVACLCLVSCAPVQFFGDIRTEVDGDAGTASHPAVCGSNSVHPHQSAAVCAAQGVQSGSVRCCWRPEPGGCVHWSPDHGVVLPVLLYVGYGGVVGSQMLFGFACMANVVVAHRQGFCVLPSLAAFSLKHLCFAWLLLWMQ